MFQLGLEFRRGEIDRVFKVVSASLASPDVTDTAGRQVVGREQLASG